MNCEKYLILIKGEDKTEDIVYCKYKNGKYEVGYKSNTYYYGYSNVNWLNAVNQYIGSEVAVYANNIVMNDIIKVVEFPGYTKLFFKSGFKKLYLKSEIKIVKNAISNHKISNCLEYLRRLANIVSINDDGVGKQYSKMGFIHPDTVLSSYLGMDKVVNRSYNKGIIFPFGFNLSQKEATKNALTSNISIIEGPPGTGKTQTILNIIANAIIDNKTVAVVSNNNSATANVAEKLKKYNLDFICAYLGNKKNKELFFNEQQARYPSLNKWLEEKEEIEKRNGKLESTQNGLNANLEKQNTLSELKQKLSELLIEKEYFDKYYKKTNKDNLYKSIFKDNSNKIMELLVQYEFNFEKSNAISLGVKIKNLIKYGIVDFKFYDNSMEDVIDYLKKYYYELKVEEVRNEISKLEKELEAFDFHDAMREYTDNSMVILKSFLAEKYKKRKERTIFDKDVLWKDFDSFINEYPVILSTTHSLRSCIGKNYLFDYVIIDESSQVDIVTGALALSCAKNAVVVGDMMQLANIVTKEIEDKVNTIFNNSNVNECYKYSENSLLSSMITVFDDAPRTLLREHYRCHPKIIGFCNKKFYNNNLVILTDEDEGDTPLKVYRTVKGNHARGKYNQRQIDVIKEEILPKINSKEKSIGIISPYRDQIIKLKSNIENDNIKIDTVHKFQGQENDVIILSTVANEINDFIDDDNLINVAVSRAKDELILVVADDNYKNQNRNIADLIRYIEYNNFQVIDSKIYSVFDLLYKSHYEKRIEFLKKKRKISQYDSENIMNVILEEILEEDEFSSIDKIIHQPLKMLIKDTKELTEDQCKFVNNPLAHTDFLLFNKIDKMPVLVVEVDGYAYHSNNSKQLKRDKLKDEILEKYGIPILRLNTNGSMEKERIREKLKIVLGA